MWGAGDTQPLQDDKKKIWTLLTKRCWGCKNFSISSLALVLELEVALVLDLELELELALG